MDEPVVECVPNFSEGTDPRRIEAIVAAMRVDGVHLLDWSMDADHNRSVVTIAGKPSAVVESAVRGAGKAAELIDLTRQQGVHPRIGAADVIPFVPISASSWSSVFCWPVRQASKSGSALAFRSFSTRRLRPGPTAAILRMYGAASSRGCATRFAKRRRGGPDLGGPGLHPTAGACAVGARKFLVAYNVFFGLIDVSLVRAIARDIRAASGGLKGVKAIGLPRPRQAQLSMNITDFATTPISQVYSKVSQLALRHKIVPIAGEVIGLLPQAACERESEWMRQLTRFDPQTKILEYRLASPLACPDRHSRCI